MPMFSFHLPGFSIFHCDETEHHHRIESASKQANWNKCSGWNSIADCNNDDDNDVSRLSSATKFKVCNLKKIKSRREWRKGEKSNIDCHAVVLSDVKMMRSRIVNGKSLGGYTLISECFSSIRHFQNVEPDFKIRI